MADPKKDQHEGGQELPPQIQDTEKQNEGYDEAARAGGGPDDAWNHIDKNAPPSTDPDDRAAEAAARDVRRRDKSAG